MKRLIQRTALHQPKLRELYSRLELKLRSLGAVIAAGILPHDSTDRFVEVYSLLEALPLTTDEFAIAKNRLRNTVAYLHSGERKASLYELRLLSQTVCPD